MIGKFEGDTFYDPYGKITGYKVGDYIMNNRYLGDILYHIHEDGTITEGTTKNIVGRITPEGEILAGTSREIIARVETDNRGSVSIPSIGFGGGGGSGKDSSDSGSGIGLIIIGVIFGGLLLYFSIFELPGVLADMFSDYAEENRQHYTSAG